MANIQFNVEGITCGGCEKSIRNALLSNTGVKEATASHKTGIVDIEYDESKVAQDQLKQAIVAAGFDVAA
jgi:copper chaperone